MTQQLKKALQKRFFAELGPGTSVFLEMLDATTDLAIYLKDATGRIMALNQRNRDICNIKDEWAAIGMKSSEIFPSAYADTYMKGDADVLKSGKPVLGQLATFPADRSQTYQISNIYPLRNRRGKIFGTARAYRLASNNELASLRYGKVKVATDYIAQHYAENISLDRLTSLCGLSRNAFIKAIRDTFAMTPWHYLTTIRLNAARELLETTDQTLADIAAETGFFDQSHLTRVFKKERGMTPGDYRRTHRR